MIAISIHNALPNESVHFALCYADSSLFIEVTGGQTLKTQVTPTHLKSLRHILKTNARIASIITLAET